MAGFPPALQRQAAIAQSRGPYRSSDAMSESGCSMSSWSVQGAAQQDPWAAEAEDDQLPPVPEDFTGFGQTPVAPAAAKVPPPQQPAQAAASSGVPTSSINQAARNLVSHANETPAQKRVRLQQEKAQRGGRRGVKWSQMGAQNSIKIELPNHLRQIGSGQGERSVLVLDTRDNRVQSPYQGFLLDEILINANAQISVLSDRALVRSPSSGYHMNLFMMKTLDGFKVTLVGSMTSYGHVPCGSWDGATAAVLKHSAFQPFRWPLMHEESPTWVDVKVKIEGQLLLHLELRGYRSDRDMTVQVNHLVDHLMWILQEMAFVPTFVVTVFQGWRVVVCSWEVGGRIYAVSQGGFVVSLGYPLCHFECRFVATSSVDSFGLDADRLEFRFRSGGDRIDVACSACSVPPSWLVVSRVPGTTMSRTTQWVRERSARVESPDQVLQLSQLAQIHAHWTVNVEAEAEDETGPRISAVAVSSNDANVHLICESPLFRKERAIVPSEALALQAHDQAQEVEAAVRPPIEGGAMVMPITAQAQNLSAIMGESTEAPLSVTPVRAEGHVQSLTDPGVSPPVSSASGRVAPAPRSLDQRRKDLLDSSAMTPADFCDRIAAINPQSRAAANTDPPLIIELCQDSLDGSACAGSTASEPKALGPGSQES